LQEAKGAGYSSAPEEEIVKQVEAIKGKYGLSDEDLKQKMGLNIEELRGELRRGWMISQFLEKAVLKGDQQNGELIIAQWLTRAKTNAKIETYEKLQPVFTAKASCCSSGSGCGGGGRARPPTTRRRPKRRERAPESPILDVIFRWILLKTEKSSFR
ncbi:MAG: hypothetical protein H6Q41_5422, partial [Deltaproteobacteria bacterium]|nr:hypothetical protein [Deltaproteobacteria bacterium]